MDLQPYLTQGRYIPVWTDDEDILLSELGAVLVRKDVPLSGFGGSTFGNLYKVNLNISGILYPGTQNRKRGRRFDCGRYAYIQRK